jgi:hypothetical protein
MTVVAGAPAAEFAWWTAHHAPTQACLLNSSRMVGAAAAGNRAPGVKSDQAALLHVGEGQVAGWCRGRVHALVKGREEAAY